MIAALFVSPRGPYAGLPNIDLWDEARDARRYAGPYPVVAHPPCSRWCRLAGLVEARWGHRKGDDGGCFASALHSVRTWGGVLEHPAYTDAFLAFGLPAPTPGGWQRTLCGGWVAHVEQGRYMAIPRRRQRGCTPTVSCICRHWTGEPFPIRRARRWCLGAATIRASLSSVHGWAKQSRVARRMPSAISYFR